MRIVWLCSELTQSGGTERLSLEGGRYFEGAGFENHHVIYPPYDRTAAFEGRYGPRVVSKNDGKTPVGMLPTIPQLRWLRRSLRELRPDVIITEGTWVHVNHVYLATLGTPFRYMVQIHGSIFPFPPRDERTKYAWVFRRHLKEIRESVYGYRENVPERIPKLGWIERLYNEFFACIKYLAVRKAERIFVLSRQNRWEVGKLYGREAVVLKGAFPKAIFGYEPRQDIRGRLGLSGKRVLFTLSRHATHKRIDLCIRAFKKLREEVRDAVLVVGGRSYDSDHFKVPEENLRSLVEELGLGRDVLFTGYIPEGELWDYYACCDVFIHMDLADFDIAPYEALALGRKVVWSEEMEVEEGLKGYPWIFPAVPRVEETALAMRRALDSPVVSVNGMARKVMSPYTWEEYFRKMRQELERVAGQ